MSKVYGIDNLILLLCTSLYPAPIHLSNLNAMSAMKNQFKTLVGYSDHTIGIEVHPLLSGFGQDI